MLAAMLTIELAYSGELADQPLGVLYEKSTGAGYVVAGTPLAVDAAGTVGNVDALDLPALISVDECAIPSSAALDRAFLYWGGSQSQPASRTPGSADDNILLTVPGGTAQALIADECYGSDGGSALYDIFVCRADITSRIVAGGGAGTGSYVIDGYSGLIADGSADNASAALILIYAAPGAEASGQVVVYDGLSTVQSETELVTLTGLNAVQPGGTLTWYTLEGDVGGVGTEAVSVKGIPGNHVDNLSDSVNPFDNPMNHTINTVMPPATDAISMDLDRFDISLTPGDTSAEVSYSAGTDKWWLAFTVISTIQAGASKFFGSGFEACDQAGPP